MGKIGEILGLPLGWIMYWIYEFVGNYGFSIILFTLLTKIILLPISYKQQLGSVRTQALSPKLAKLRKQYANNPQKLQEEQQRLYAEEGVNPMGSCLPMIISLIILYGVLDVVYRPLSHILRISSDIIDKAKTIITENNLADKYFSTRPELTILKQVKENPDLFTGGGISADTVNTISEFKNTFLGIDLGVIPSINPDVWNKTAIGLIMIPVISGLVQLLFTIYTQYKSRKLNPEMTKAQGAGCMNAVLYGMPIFSVWLAFSVPAGVGFYWIWSSVFSFLQSFLLYCYFTPARMKKINAKIKEKNKNKPGLMQKMLAQQNELAKGGSGSGKRVDYEEETKGMSRSQKQNYNKQLIKEARKKMAEKYGEEYTEDDKE